MQKDLSKMSITIFLLKSFIWYFIENPISLTLKSSSLLYSKNMVF